MKEFVLKGRLTLIALEKLPNIGRQALRPSRSGKGGDAFHR
jgi:hypothetical protein